MKLEKITLITGIILLAAATLNLPYGFYELLRITITIISIYLSYYFYSIDSMVIFVLFVLVAILFNPIMVIHFEKDIWRIIDLAVAGTFLFVLVNISINPKK